MTTIIQVCGCTDIDDEVCPFVPDNEPEFYGVYLGDDGPPFEWIADFMNKTDALKWAEDVAKCYDGAVDDRTYMQEEVCQQYPRP